MTNQTSGADKNLTKQTSQNSIVFLAALGVYIGLVVAGASPGFVSQQAALTRGFDISDEMEVSDDLDKDPEPAGSAEQAGSKDRLALFTFSDLFSGVVSAAFDLPALPGPFEFASPLADLPSSAALPIPRLSAKVTVSNLARAGI